MAATMAKMMSVVNRSFVRHKRNTRAFHLLGNARTHGALYSRSYSTGSVVPTQAYYRHSQGERQAQRHSSI